MRAPAAQADDETGCDCDKADDFHGDSVGEGEGKGRNRCWGAGRTTRSVHVVGPPADVNNVSIMKTKACSVMIRIWKIAHTVPATMWPGQQHAVTDSVNAHQREQEISSPAYMLPNNRMPCDTVLATNSTIIAS